jgi:hypothetical protein
VCAQNTTQQHTEQLHTGVCVRGDGDVDDVYVVSVCDVDDVRVCGPCDIDMLQADLWILRTKFLMAVGSDFQKSAPLRCARRFAFHPKNGLVPDASFVVARGPLNTSAERTGLCIARDSR